MNLCPCHLLRNPGATLTAPLSIPLCLKHLILDASLSAHFSPSLLLCSERSALPPGSLEMPPAPWPALVPGWGPHALRQAQTLWGTLNSNPSLEVLGPEQSYPGFVLVTKVDLSLGVLETSVPRAPSSLLIPISSCARRGHCLRAHQFFHLKNNALML